MSYRFARVLVVLFVVAAIPAFGGVVSVSGDAVVFDAGIGEENKVVVNGLGAAFDQSTGGFVTGVSISDLNQTPTALAPCRVVAGTAICPRSGIGRAVIRLGNRNDSASLDFVGAGPLLSMNVDGGLDDDTINGGPAADTLDGGAGTDIINGGGGDDQITGGLGDDTIDGGNGKDHLFGNAGKDVINGDSGDDEIDGGIGDDTIDGGDGVDVIRGDAGGDRITGQDGFADNINCGIGIDKLLTRDGNDTVKRCE
jgi:Ca2+-binding RTX toxin-like protein